MEHLDITLDFETCALGADAAVIQMAAVAWNRHADYVHDVFTLRCEEGVINLSDENGSAYVPETFNFRFDLADQVFHGRKFSDGTLDFWANKQKAAVKDGILKAEMLPTYNVLYNFAEWVADLQKQVCAKSVCLWAQGTDFDMSILRHICEQYAVKIPSNIYKNFRDARTYIMEVGGAVTLTDANEAHRNSNSVYEEINKVLGEPSFSGCPHDALYDSMLTSRNTWYSMYLMNKFLKLSRIEKQGEQA